MTTVDTIAVAEVVEPLSIQETADLAACEAVIQRGLNTFIEVGEAMGRIRDERLYRQTHSSFEAYLGERWPQFRGRRMADRYIEAAEVQRNLGPIGLSVQNESQARALAGLDPEQQRQAMQTAVMSAPNGKPTAKEIARAAAVVVEPSLYALPTPEEEEDLLRRIDAHGWPKVGERTRGSMGTRVLTFHHQGGAEGDVELTVNELRSWAEQLDAAARVRAERKSADAVDTLRAKTPAGYIWKRSEGYIWIVGPGGWESGTHDAPERALALAQQHAAETPPPGWKLVEEDDEWYAEATTGAVTYAEESRTLAAASAWVMHLTALATQHGATVNQYGTRAAWDREWQIVWADGREERLGSWAALKVLESRPTPSALDAMKLRPGDGGDRFVSIPFTQLPDGWVMRANDRVTPPVYYLHRRDDTSVRTIPTKDRAEAIRMAFAMASGASAFAAITPGASPLSQSTEPQPALSLDDISRELTRLLPLAESRGVWLVQQLTPLIRDRVPEQIDDLSLAIANLYECNDDRKLGVFAVNVLYALLDVEGDPV